MVVAKKLFVKGAVSQESTSFCFNFANYSPSIAVQLKVNKEITGQWQNQRSETNKYVSVQSVIFEVASGRDQRWKTIRPNSFQKP